MPCRNEVDYIEGVIESIMQQDYPKDLLEIIVADGVSDDGTKEKLKVLQESADNLKVIDNPDRVTPHALNAAIKASKGEVIIRFDAHAVFPSEYVSRLIKALDDHHADNVGGVLLTLPANDSLEARAVAQAMASRFGVGNASFRTGAKTAIEVDTVPFGCFRKSVFDELGLFDTDLIRNQDDEFNARMIQAGKKIVLLPDLEIKYFARSSFKKMRQMYFQYGLFKPLVNRKLRHPATLRQFVPLVFVAGLLVFPLLLFSELLVLVWASAYITYVLMNLIISVKTAFSQKSPRLIPYLFKAFLSIHLSYGWGYLNGFFKFVLIKGKVNTDQTHLSR
jgi:glycosyltransferase involved in cell wall biosynthesis